MFPTIVVLTCRYVHDQDLLVDNKHTSSPLVREARRWRSDSENATRPSYNSNTHHLDQPITRADWTQPSAVRTTASEAEAEQAEQAGDLDVHSLDSVEDDWRLDDEGDDNTDEENDSQSSMEL